MSTEVPSEPGARVGTIPAAPPLRHRRNVAATLLSRSQPWVVTPGRPHVVVGASLRYRDELGDHFIETSGSHRWLNVMSAIRVETVDVPAGVFRAFVVERTTQSLAPGPRPVATFTYWYAPDARTIVKVRTESGDGSPATTEDADVLGYPLSRSSTASLGGVD